MVQLNVLSIVLGLLAWALALAAVGWKKHRLLLFCPFASMTCCAAAIMLQHFATGWLVLHDLSAAIDTSEGYPLGKVSAFLLGTTLVLNIGAFVIGHFQKRQSAPN